MARGALSNAVTQGIGVATGLQSKFSFAGVAAAGIGAGVGAFVGDKLGAVDFSDKGGLSAANIAANGVVGAASAIANAATRSLINGTNFGDNILAALPDVIAQTVGGVLENGVSANNGLTDNVDEVIVSGQKSQQSSPNSSDEIVVAAQRGLTQDEIRDWQKNDLTAEKLDLADERVDLLKKQRKQQTVVNQLRTDLQTARLNGENERSIRRLENQLAKAERSKRLTAIADRETKIEVRQKTIARLQSIHDRAVAQSVGTDVALNGTRTVNERTSTTIQTEDGPITNIVEISYQTADPTYRIKGPGAQFWSKEEAALDAIALSFAVKRLLGDQHERGGTIIAHRDGGFSYDNLLVGTEASRDFSIRVNGRRQKIKEGTPYIRFDEKGASGFFPYPST